jgi:CRP-like cAMP-binding protein
MAQRVLSNTIKTDFVKSIPLLSGLSESEKESLLQGGTLYTYRRKEHLFRRGDPVNRFHIICDGTVRLYRETSGGGEVTTDIRISGDTICKTGVFSSFVRHHCHAEIVHDATIMEFPTQWLVDAAKKYSVISANLLSALSQGTREVKIESENHMMMSTVQRAACFLKKTCVIQGLNPSGFKLPYSKSLIASRLGMRLETFSRTLPRLKEVGIKINDRQVSLYDLSSIEDNLCSHCPGAEDCFARKALMSANGRMASQSAQTLQSAQR